MAKSKISLTKGDFEVKINDETILLNSRFENQDFLEQYSNIGIYALTVRLEGGDVRIGDIARILYCFCDSRDEDGKSFNDFGEKVTRANFKELLNTLQKFWQIVHRLEEMEEVTLEMGLDEKPNRKQRRTKASTTKKKKVETGN